MSNQAKVTVTGDEYGNVIHVSEDKPEYGYIRVEQVVNVVSETGWFKPTKRSALIKGLVEDLKQGGFYKNQELPGKIIVKESLTPFNSENPDKNLKIAGDTGIICRVDDQPIYRDTFYTTNLDAADQLIMHDDDCREEIRQVGAATRALRKNVALNKVVAQDAQL